MPLRGEISRGNTSKGVNNEIFNILIQRSTGKWPRLLDVPCGSGDLLDAVTTYLPQFETHGADVRRPDESFRHRFIPVDASHSSLHGDSTFDVITSVSGIMEFDNTLFFLENLRRVITEDGLLLVTNDNILTVRDRLLYLFRGRFGQYRFETKPGTPTWKILPFQNLVRILLDAGFEVIETRFVPVLRADWLWIVLAFPLYLIELLSRNSKNLDTFRNDAFSLKAMLSRHYILVCKPSTPNPQRSLPQ